MWAWRVGAECVGVACESAERVVHGCLGMWVCRLCGHGCGGWCEGVDLFFSFICFVCQKFKKI